MRLDRIDNVTVPVSISREYSGLTLTVVAIVHPEHNRDHVWSPREDVPFQTKIDRTSITSAYFIATYSGIVK
jgi:hypothetical protein